ncbi:hypothetical protein B0H19DRAFT_1262250 [Mycena capillaripes]|nr:hypothetical protein B0H19DRAFT_1262250 [Mycena capillaripes]
MVNVPPLPPHLPLRQCDAADRSRVGIQRAGRSQCSVFAQLRTAHSAHLSLRRLLAVKSDLKPVLGALRLNAYLYRFHLALSPDCDLCLVAEMVPHFLLSRPRYRRQHLDLIFNRISLFDNATPRIGVARAYSELAALSAASSPSCVRRTLHASHSAASSL